MRKIKNIELQKSGSIILSFENSEDYRDVKKFIIKLAEIGESREDGSKTSFSLKRSEKTNKLLIEDKKNVQKNKGINELLEGLKLNNIECPALNNNFEQVPNEAISETDSLLRKKLL
jgi:hypothetical protein